VGLLKKQKKLINIPIAQEFIKRVAGQDAVRVIKIYEKKGKYVTDEELAKKMKLKVTEIRTILNRLHYRGIACYQKSKNTKTGWYSYTWIIKSKRIADLLLEEMQENLEKMENKQTLHSNYGLFSCNTNCGMVPFEVAAEYDFRCPDCGNSMDILDNNKVLKDTEAQLKELRYITANIKKAI
tara:strand:- start:576 stop:1121 length:546 start_codon:yes stop_codon:yes gene_type:complete